MSFFWKMRNDLRWGACVRRWHVIGMIVLSICFFCQLFCAEEIAKVDPLVYEQSDRQTIFVRKHPKRVVIAYGSLAKVWELSGGRAVGVPTLSEKNALPESMRDLPSSGSPTAPNPEAIAALRPDLVLLIGKLQRHRACAELLRGMKMDAVCVDYNNYEDFNKLLEFFCQINGNSLDQMPAIKQLSEQVEALCRKAKKYPSPSCAIMFASSAGLSLESSGTNTGMMVQMLGGRNLLGQKTFSRVHFSLEQLMKENPDVILVITMGNEKMLQKRCDKEYFSQSVWRELKAVRKNRVHYLPSELFLYMPGPDFPEAFRYLGALLYPEEEWK